MCKKLFGRINHHQLLSEYILRNFFCFLSNMINCQEQLKAIQQTEKKKKCASFLGVCIVSLIALCDTIYKWLYDGSKFLLVLAFFGGIWNDSPCKRVVDVVLKVFWWFWTFSWIIMFIPSNFRITFGFTNVTWSTRTISFIDNTRFVFIFSRKQRSYISSFPHYYHTTIVGEFVNTRKNLEASYIALWKPVLNEQKDFERLVLFINGVT